MCRDWRGACSDDVCGPKVRLELRSVRQVLHIRPECLGLWVAMTVRQFAWVVDLDLSQCGIEDGVLECAVSLQRLSSFDLGGVYRCPSKIMDTGLEHGALLTQLTSLNLSHCAEITDTGLEHVAQLMHLTSLNFSDCVKITGTGRYKIMDMGLEHVAQLTQLTSLDLQCCGEITDTGLEHVAHVAQLEHAVDEL